MMRARGVRPSFWIAASEATMMAEAPSLRVEELPAVTTEPPGDDGPEPGEDVHGGAGAGAFVGVHDGLALAGLDGDGDDFLPPGEAEEIVPVTVKTRKGETVVDTDEGPRAGTTMDVLAGLRPVVKGGSIVTAGNSSTLNDGASAIIVASEAAIQKLGLTARARIIDGASAGCEPEIMGIGPVPATQKVLARSGLSVDDLGAVELNEAFATQSLASMRRLGLDPEIVNRDGGAISLGHPLGSSGSRIAITLLGRMERENAKIGLATMCIGVGQGTAMLLERVYWRPPALDPAGFGTLLVEEREDRVVVVLNRPEVHNAIDQQRVDELHTSAPISSGAQIVPSSPALTGCSASAPTQTRTTMPCRAWIGDSSGSPSCRCAVAALDGFCLGGGTELALRGQLRIGHSSGSAIPKPDSASLQPHQLAPQGTRGEPVAARRFGAPRRTCPRGQSHHRNP